MTDRQLSDILKPIYNQSLNDEEIKGSVVYIYSKGGHIITTFSSDDRCTIKMETHIMVIQKDSSYSSLVKHVDIDSIGSVDVETFME